MTRRVRLDPRDRAMRLLGWIGVYAEHADEPEYEGPDRGELLRLFEVEAREYFALCEGQ